MTEINETEMDLDSMSMDDLDSLLSDAEGKPKAEVEPEPEKETPLQETSIQTETDDQEQVVAEEVQAEPEGKPQESQEVNDEESGIEPQYRGKSKEDLLEMQRNANRKISKQSNELYHLKKKMEEFMSSQTKRQEEQTVKPEDELISQYEAKDINAIETLIERKLSKLETAKLEQVNAVKNAAMTEHDEMWENLKIFNPSLFSRIESEALQVMKSDKENTYQRKGWMKQFITDRAKANTTETTVKPPVKPVARKKAATISGGGVSRNSGTIINKQVEDMTASEFEQHMATKGIKF